MDQLRIGIIGCGRMGQEHARAATILGARVCLLYDCDISRSQMLADRYPASSVLQDWKAIDWRAIDAVFVCTPPSCRGPVEMSAASAGVPIFVEKPVGISAEQCRQLERALITTPVINSVGYMNRYRDSVLRAREFLAHREPVGIACNWVCAPYRVAWWSQRDHSGGPFNEQATHFVDLCRFLMGEVVEVFAFALSKTSFDDTITVTLSFANGALGTLLYSCRASDKQIDIRIFSTTGGLELEGWDLRLKDDDGKKGYAEDPYVKEDAAFFAAIEAADQSLIKSSVAEAIRTQMVVDAVHRSLLSRKPEKIALSSNSVPMAAAGNTYQTSRE